MFSYADLWITFSKGHRQVFQYIFTGYISSETPLWVFRSGIKVSKIGKICQTALYLIIICNSENTILAEKYKDHQGFLNMILVGHKKMPVI